MSKGYWVTGCIVSGFADQSAGSQGPCLLKQSTDHSTVMLLNAKCVKHLSYAVNWRP